MPQTWLVNGQHLNRDQMQALAAERQKAREAGKELDKNIVKVEVKPAKKIKVIEEEMKVEDLPFSEDEVTLPDYLKNDEEEKSEFELLKKKRAWLKPELKDRYNQLKAKWA